MAGPDTQAFPQPDFPAENPESLGLDFGDTSIHPKAGPPSTRLAEAPKPPPAREGSRAFRLVDGREQPSHSSETQLLRHRRLRIMAAFLFVIMGFMLVVWTLGNSPYSPLTLSMVGVAVGLTGLFLVLLRRSDQAASPLLLRVAEFTIFGAAALAGAIGAHDRILKYAGDYGVNVTLYGPWYLLIMLHSLYVPNTWRRSAPVVAVFVLTPMGLLLTMRALYPEVAAAWGFGPVAAHTIGLTLSAVCGAVGADSISKLRREVYDARELGQYRLLKRIGSGGMGKVYLAEHALLKRPCAIKVLHPELTRDRQTRERFEREVQAAASLSHWNTIGIYDYGVTDDGTFYYVMEHLPGMSLQDLLEQTGPIHPERVIYIMRQVCGALHEAHLRGFVHRDIKPSNILAAQRGGAYDVAKLLDFGLVRAIHQSKDLKLTDNDFVIGSPHTMSPEQALGDEEIDGRSDIYSLAVTAYCALTSRYPFEAKEPVNVLVGHIEQEPPPPSRFNPTIPRDLEALILKCMAKKPGDRIQSAVALESALARCLDANAWTQARANAWWRAYENRSKSGRMAPLPADLLFSGAELHPG